MDDQCLKYQFDFLKESSIYAVIDAKKTSFSNFKKYMHIKREPEALLLELIKKTYSTNKSELILVCGNVGDGKSHIISKLKNENNELFEKFIIKNDATETRRSTTTYLDDLRELFSPFSNDNFQKNIEVRKIIVAINLGTLNNFIDEEGKDFYSIVNFVKENRILDDEIVENTFKDKGINFINFTDYKMYSLSKTNAISPVIRKVFDKIVGEYNNNPFHKIYTNICSSCQMRNFCPIKTNYEIIKSLKNQLKIENLLIKLMLEYKMIISMRKLFNFMYDLVVPYEFSNLNKENIILGIGNTLNKPDKFLNNIIINYMFSNEEVSDIFKILSKVDPIKNHKPELDEIIIALNTRKDIKEILEKYLKIDNQALSDAFGNYIVSIQNDKNKENKILDFFIRLYYFFSEGSNIHFLDENYEEYMKLLYSYNIGKLELDALESLYEDLEKVVYLWNGKNNFKNEVNINVGFRQLRYTVSQELKFYPYFENLPNYNVNDSEEIIKRFISKIILSYKVNDSNDVFNIDIDLALYRLIKKILSGYRPNNNDKSLFVNFVTFINNLNNLGSKRERVIISEEDKRYSLFINKFNKIIFEEIK